MESKKEYELEQYVNELGEVLEKFDCDTFRDFFYKYQHLYDKESVEVIKRELHNDTFVKVMMSQMIFMRSDMSPEAIERAENFINEFHDVMDKEEKDKGELN